MFFLIRMAFWFSLVLLALPLSVGSDEPGQESVGPIQALFAALATLVRQHGEDATAELVAGLPDRIRAGEYNLDRSLQ